MTTPFCTEAVVALAEDACLALPEQRPSELMIYLHGIIPPGQASPQLDNFMKVVAESAQKGGVVALIPRGDPGLAPKRYRGWWGWPTSTGTYRRLAATLIERIEAHQRALEQHLGFRLKRRYVAGSSAGGYFASLIALNGGLAADGFGAMAGAAGSRTPALAQQPARPFYVGFGEHDSVSHSSRALAKLLEGAGWPVKVGVHPVGHGARAVYIDEAIPFWRKHAPDP